ncbi:YeeE/YedE thiosulfate transporter family protein [Bacteroidota bacterium]
MGPLIPNGIIPMEWNYIIAIFIGMAFGYILESSGFSSSRKLAGVFYGYDFVVLKVFFTAAAVSVIGLYYMDYLNWVDISQLYVHPTYLWAAIVGGVIMGIGFLSGGFCPGTSFCGAAIGKIDAIVFTIGILLGVFIFAEAFSVIEPLFTGSSLGNITMVDVLEISPYTIILIFAIIAILSFIVADIVRTKVKNIFY